MKRSNISNDKVNTALPPIVKQNSNRNNNKANQKSYKPLMHHKIQKTSSTILKEGNFDDEFEQNKAKVKKQNETNFEQK